MDEWWWLVSSAVAGWGCWWRVSSMKWNVEIEVSSEFVWQVAGVASLVRPGRSGSGTW